MSDSKPHRDRKPMLRARRPPMRAPAPVRVEPVPWSVEEDRREELIALSCLTAYRKAM